MKTIDLNELNSVSGGVMDSGDGQGCTRSGGCIPNPWPQPGQPWPRPQPLPLPGTGLPVDDGGGFPPRSLRTGW